MLEIVIKDRIWFWFGIAMFEAGVGVMGYRVLDCWRKKKFEIRDVATIIVSMYMIVAAFMPWSARALTFGWLIVYILCFVNWENVLGPSEPESPKEGESLKCTCKAKKPDLLTGGYCSECRQIRMKTEE